MVKPYWQKRSEQTILDSEKISAQMEKTRLKQAYQVAYNNILSQINGVQASLTEQGFSVDMAKSLNSQQKRDYASLVRQYNAEAKKIAKNGDYRELKPLSTVIKGSRLTAFKNQLDIELSLLAAGKEEMIGDTLQDVYKHASYKTVYDLSKQVGAQVAFDRIDKKTALKAVKTNFAGTNFSSSIWQDKNKLSQSLQSLIPQQFIIGTSTQNIARQLRDKLNVSYRNAIRLARTETNFVANMGMEDTYKRAGVQKYQVLATLDSRTSDICQEMDGYIGELSKAVPGVNYPPFHPNCRTTTIPYFDDEEMEQRIMRDEEGNNEFDENLSYTEWLEEINVAQQKVPQADPEDLNGADAIGNKKENEVPDYPSMSAKELRYLMGEVDDLPDSVIREIKRYTEDNNLPNSTLRRFGVSSKQAEEFNIKQVIREGLKIKTTDNFTLYRGDGVEFLSQQKSLYDKIQSILDKEGFSPAGAKKVNDLLVGKNLIEPGFRSASYEENKWGGQIQWVISIPKGSGGVLPLDRISANSEEQEVLIVPGQGYQINKVTYDPKKESFKVFATLKNISYK